MTRLPLSTGGPDRQAALEQYRRRARVYDRELALFEPIRRLAVAGLGLRPGDVVLDVGCGTGLSLALIRQGIGTTGRIIGIEQSPEMIEQARRRVTRHRWTGVTLTCAPVEAADIDSQADAALFHFTHDILRQPEAIANVLRHLKPGARVVASGLKWAAPLRPVNLFVLSAALRSVTSLDGMDRPWGLLEQQLGRMKVQPRLFGGAYLASGVRSPPSRRQKKRRMLD
jgi:ubiquinone/menaquinone biosynthesis C-methylase UbiE